MLQNEMNIDIVIKNSNISVIILKDFWELETLKKKLKTWLKSQELTSIKQVFYSIMLH